MRILVLMLLVVMSFTMLFMPGQKTVEAEITVTDVDSARIDKAMQPVIELAKTDHVAVIDRCLDAWRKRAWIPIQAFLSSRNA